MPIIKYAMMLMASIILFSACSSGQQAIAVEATETFAPENTCTPVPTATATATTIPTATSAPVPTATPTQALVEMGPGPIECPILLYHRVVPGQDTNPYNLSPDVFEEQMRYLYDNGYATITIEQLRDAIVNGAELPEKPIVISFDDGDISVYKRAFPIMEKYGYTGVAYLVTTYLETDGYMKIRHVKELIKGGWEIGSHTSRHADVTTTQYIDTEVIGSREDLMKLFDVKVNSFAYPFGLQNPSAMRKVSEWYTNAVGLGPTITQKESNLYYLWRRPVDNGTTMEQFIGFLK